VASTTSTFKTTTVTSAHGTTNSEFTTYFSFTICSDYTTSSDLAATPELASPSTNFWNRVNKDLSTISSTACNLHATSDTSSYFTSDTTPTTFSYNNGNKLDRLEGEDGTRVSEVDEREYDGDTCITTEAS